MKVVLLHDWLTGFRGGERVLEVFAQLFPQSPLYTLFYQKGSTSQTIENRPIYPSWLNRIPSVHKRYRMLLPLYPAAVSKMKIFENADLVLSSSHCLIKALKMPSQHTKHLCYIHSPMRYLYDQYENYFGPDAPWPHRYGAKIFRNYLQNFDIKSNAQVDKFLANSAFVQQRVKKYYHRDSTIVHPFVDLQDFAPLRKIGPTKQDYYLMVTAFAPNKRVDLAIKAFNKWGRPLKIIGGGQQNEMLRNMAKDNIEFLGNLSRQEVIDYYGKARGFVFPGVEDFGITPLESLAAATAVIAYKTGGVLETLNNDVAQFFEQPTVESLLGGLEEFESRQFDMASMHQQATKFSKEKFIANIKREINILMGER